MGTLVGAGVAGRAIGGTVAGTGQAGVGQRAFHEWCGLFTVWNVPVIVFVPQRRPRWFCRVCWVTISTDRAKDTFPLVQVFVCIVQVFISFASAPWWQFTPGTFVVGYFF
jgi:hypothetical protein